MHANHALIEQFYTAFQNKDHEAMAACYHQDAYFRDEAFELTGKQIGAMWHMLCERGTDMTMTFLVQEKAGEVTAHWEPRYTFSQNGRKVHNIIDATFEFKDGLIINHIDQFNFWSWSKQALGTIGALLGWSGFLRNKVKTMANKNLTHFIAKHGQYKA